MSFNYALYWKTYSDFKKNNYNLAETATVRRKTTAGTTYYTQGELDIYWTIDSIKWAEDPFATTLGTTSSFVQFQMAYADFLLAFSLIPVSGGTTTTITNSGGIALCTTGYPHNLTDTDTIRFLSVPSPWTFYGVQVVSPTTFYTINLATGLPVTYTANRTDTYYKNLLGMRTQPFSAKNIFDFNNYVTQPITTSEIYTARTLANLHLASSNRYITLYDFKFDNLNCIVNARGEFKTTPAIYT